MRKMLAAVALAATLSACGAGTGSVVSAPGTPETRTLTVFAAASLTESFGALERQFEAAHAGVNVKSSFEGSSALVQKLTNGAKADVFASADEANLQKAIDSGDVVGPPSVFAKNRLEIAVEKGNPKKVGGLADLAKSGLVVVLCADAVPCGKYAAQAFANAGVSVSPASKEENAKATLSKVSLGEADASVVYVTDVRAAKGEVSGVKIPDRQNVIATYAIAVTKENRGSAAAKAWVQFIQSKSAQTALRKFGFLPP